MCREMSRVEMFGELPRVNCPAGDKSVGEIVRGMFGKHSGNCLGEMSRSPYRITSFHNYMQRL